MGRRRASDCPRSPFRRDAEHQLNISIVTSRVFVVAPRPSCVPSSELRRTEILLIEHVREGVVVVPVAALP
jgi:hypothetical protein